MKAKKKINQICQTSYYETYSGIVGIKCHSKKFPELKAIMSTN